MPTIIKDKRGREIDISRFIWSNGEFEIIKPTQGKDKEKPEIKTNNENLKPKK